MTTVWITYPGGKGIRFDRTYYAAKHLPLVMECWLRFGLQSVAAFYPEHDGKGLIAICVCVFTNDEAVRASFASERTREIMDDVARFTDAKPSQFLAVPL